MTPHFLIISSLMVFALQVVADVGENIGFGTLVLSADHEPVAPGDIVTFTIDYATGTEFINGQRILQATIPVGLHFLSASDGGLFINGAVNWYFEAVPALERGQRQCSVQVDSGTSIGSAMTVSVLVLGNPTSYTWNITSHIQPKQPLELSVQGSPRWPNPEAKVVYAITARNSGSTAVPSVRLSLAWDQSCVYPLTASWNLGDLEAGASRTVTYQMDFFGCVLNSASLDRVTVDARFLGSSYPVRSVTALWENPFDDRQLTLRIDGISPASPSPSTTEIPISIRGSGLSPDITIVFRSGPERIEISPEKIDFISPNEIRTAVALPAGSTLWVLHMIRYPDVAQYVFDAGSSLQLVQPEVVDAGRAFRCWLKGGAGRHVSVQWSSDLVQWKDSTNFMPTGESVLVIDGGIGSEALRYYRARSSD